MQAESQNVVDLDVMIGEIVDGYRIKRKIASGGMGIVYEAIHENLGRKYAIKMLQPHYMGNPQIVSRFIAEGQKTNRLDIDGVVAVHHLGRTSRGVPFLVMDYIDGESINSYRHRLFGKRERRLPGLRGSLRATPSPTVVLNVLRLTRQLAQTLCLIHQQGVVHRDLKPDNIFVVRDACVSGGYRVKVMDFGIAKYTASDQTQTGQSVPWAPPFEPTMKGTVLGTPAYMSPEQWHANGMVHPKTDVYACGVIFYELISGRPPFTAEFLAQLMDQHMTQKPTPLSTVEPWVPAAFSELVDSMLRKNPDDRPDMAKVLESLDSILRVFLAQRSSPGERSGSGIQTLIDGVLAPDSVSLSSVAGGAVVSHHDLLPWRRQRTRRWAIGFTLFSLLGLGALALLVPSTESLEGPKDPTEKEGPQSGETFTVHSDPEGASVYLWNSGDDLLDTLLRPRCAATPCVLKKEELTKDQTMLLMTKAKYHGLRISASDIRKDNYQVLVPLSPLRRADSAAKRR